MKMRKIWSRNLLKTACLRRERKERQEMLSSRLKGVLKSLCQLVRERDKLSIPKTSILKILDQSPMLSAGYQNGNVLASRESLRRRVFISKEPRVMLKLIPMSLGVSLKVQLIRKLCKRSKRLTNVERSEVYLSY